MSNARSWRRRQARTESKKQKSTGQQNNWAFTPPTGPIDVDAWVDDNEAHIKELNDEPIMKWFAKSLVKPPKGLRLSLRLHYQ